MKVLFLDIDGVANDMEHAVKVDIKPSLAEKIQQIIEATGCEVVLSSTWRLDANSRSKVREKICDFYDVTPNLPQRYRGDEVMTWLMDHRYVDRFAVVDDDTDFPNWMPFFRTNIKTGITQEVADAIIDYLKGRTVYEKSNRSF